MTFRIDVFTLFPEYFAGPLDASLIGKAQANGILTINRVDYRQFTHDKHHTVDDAPFGGGAGMVIRPEPLFEAVEATHPPRPLYMLSAAGDKLTHQMAVDIAGGEGFSLICGRYEGIDQRVTDHLCDGEISVSDVVISGGEAAALVVIEAVARLIPGVMGNEESSEFESFSNGLLEHPQYTRPAEYRGYSVPEVLLSGDHAAVARYREAESRRLTRERRPDLITP